MISRNLGRFFSITSRSFEQSRNIPDRHFILRYVYVSGMAQKRKPIRESHLKHIAEYIKSGHFVLGGAFTDVSGAALLFKADTEDPVYQFVKNDPFYLQELVKEYEIKEIGLLQSDQLGELLKK